MTNPIQTIYPVFRDNPVITTDSRQVQPGSIFFALKGESFNGNDFAAPSVERGAALAVVDDRRLEGHPRCLVVEDVLQTLQGLARHHREQFRIPVIAITGTNGKTTTKELTHAVLSRQYNTLATRGNLNNHIGVPLTLLGIREDTGIALVEMGANHPGEIDLLCRIALPGFGLVTNIGKAHLEGFGGFEGVVRTKTEMYRFLEKAGGTIFLNAADELLIQHAPDGQVIRYGTPGDEVYGTGLEAEPFVRLQMHFKDGQEAGIRSKLFGRYNAVNLLAAAAIGSYFNVSPDKIRAALEEYQPENNRSQVKETPKNLLILDAYNANPSSMAAALDNFAASGLVKKVVILGDMLELGEESAKEHLAILKRLERMGLASVFLVGPVFTALNTNRDFTCFNDSELARIWLEHHPVSGASVLIKGSRGIKLESVVEAL